jgi:hypothetical protein
MDMMIESGASAKALGAVRTGISTRNKSHQERGRAQACAALIDDGEQIQEDTWKFDRAAQGGYFLCKT